MGASDVDVETIRQGILAEVPFPHGGCLVARLLDAMGPSHDVFAQSTGAGDMQELAVLGIAAGTCPHVVDFVARGVLPGEEAGPGGGAIGGAQ